MSTALMILDTVADVASTLILIVFWPEILREIRAAILPRLRLRWK